MKLTVSIAQMAVVTAKPEENLKNGEAFIAEAARRKSGIICFPEMWTTGFDWEYNKRAAREHEKVIDRIAGMAKRYNIWINGSTLALNESGKPSNASILFNPKGARAATYRKTHLYRLAHEDKFMEAGGSLCMADAPWGRTGLAVCYDLRFPELFRTYALEGAKIVFLPAAFPYPKLHHWKALVAARAIENQMFVVAVNQVGSEDRGEGGVSTYFGSSAIIDPWGETVAEAGEGDETLLTATIDLDKVDEIRSKMRVLKDRRPDLYELG